MAGRKLDHYRLAPAAEADLESARIRLGYTRVRAEWDGDDTERIVGQRYVEAGDTISADDDLLRVVDLDPLRGTVFVTERDYPGISQGNRLRLRTDAYPGEAFEAEVVRIAPVFSEESRQARVEFRVENQDARLRPGMFARVDLVLDERDEAQLIPVEAIVRRDGRDGVFLIGDEGDTARWRLIETGISDGENVEVLGKPLSGSVVVLGQQFLEDGTSVRIVEDSTKT